MQKVDNYIREFLNKEHESGNAWALIGQEIFSDEFALKRLKSSLRLLNKNFDDNLDEDESFKNLVSLGKEQSFSLLLQNIVPSIIEDIQEWTNYAYDQQIKNTRIVLAPLRTFSAFSLDRDENSTLFDGYVIFVNQALYFCLRLLAKASLIENLQGDYATFRSDGSPFYCDAIKLLFTANSQYLNEMSFEGMVPEALGQVDVVQSQATMIVLIFVVLHELGHIVHNDFEILDAHRLQAADLVDNQGRSSNNGLKTRIEREFRADQFAIDIICRKAKTELEMWANFSQIYLFFLWLSDCENQCGQPFSDNHPAPIKRAETLLEYVQSISHCSEEVLSYLQWLRNVTKKWSAKMDIDFKI